MSRVSPLSSCRTSVVIVRQVGASGKSSQRLNNAVYWQALEELVPTLGIDLRQPVQAELDYRQPIDFGEAIDLVPFADEGGSAVAFVADGAVTRAVARIGPIGSVP